MEKSYSIIYKGDIEKSLNDSNIDNYIVLNGELAVLYVDDDFDDNSPEDAPIENSPVVNSPLV